MFKHSPAKKHLGFSYVEIMILFLLVALLSGCVVQNFIKAQIRAKVSRVHADLRSIATAVESYSVDNNGLYPPTPLVLGGDVPLEMDRFGVMRVIPNFLSSPIAYLASAGVEDVFVAPEMGDYQMLRREPLGGSIVGYRPISVDED